MKNLDSCASLWKEDVLSNEDEIDRTALVKFPLPETIDVAGIHPLRAEWMQGGRFIRWQVSLNVLRLVEMAPLGKRLRGNALRLIIRNGIFHPSAVSLASRHDELVMSTCLCVATSSMTLFRLVFHLRREEAEKESMFQAWDFEKQSFSIFDDVHFSPTCMHLLDFHSLAFGLSSGGLALGTFLGEPDIGQQRVRLFFLLLQGGIQYINSECREYLI